VVAERPPSSRSDAGTSVGVERAERADSFLVRCHRGLDQSVCQTPNSKEVRTERTGPGFPSAAGLLFLSQSVGQQQLLLRAREMGSFGTGT